MRILHLSDLHKDDAHDSLHAIWNAPQGALRLLPNSDQKFDFIIVSGDLSSRAAPHEYAELLGFAEDVLLNLLRKPGERRRVIFVPGNHDVDWSADLGTSVGMSEVLSRQGGEGELAAMVRSYHNDPARSGIRRSISRFGHIEWIRLDDSKQANRFANVQKFFNDFYGDASCAPDKHLDLLSHHREGNDWSAHLFPEERIAFYGFNSCFMNDRYWTGAAICHESIARATTHANEHARDFLRIAVWHHGIHTDSYRPDYLNQSDVGELIVSGFQVGFHGHTHRAAGDLLSWIGGRFVLVSTGSLGANQEHRPDAVGRQFSIVQLYPHQANVQVYERTNSSTAYTPKPSRSYSLLNPIEQDHRQPSAGVHHRHYHLDRHGISAVHVQLKNLLTPRPVPLAEVGAPVCDARSVDRPELSPGYEVRRTLVNDGGIRFKVYPHEYRPIDISWRYEASNFVPLTQAELPLYNKALGRSPGEDVFVLRPHCVRFACKSLTLKFTFDEPLFEHASVEARVQRPTSANFERHWVRVLSEERRCEVHAVSETEIHLHIEAPIVGNRYAIAYRPSKAGGHLDYTASRIAKRLLGRCLGDRTRGPEVSLRLGDAITQAVRAVFGHNLNSVQWTGFLWNDELRALMTAFGNFPNCQWGCRHACGAGIAGHAFRFNRTVAWSRKATHTRDALVYQPPPHRHWQSEFDWIVCLPLVADTRKNPIGVIQFEGLATDPNFGDRLYEFAEAALNGRVQPESDWSGFQKRLSTAINTGFWQACAALRCLADYRRPIHTLIGELGLGSVPDTEVDTCDGVTS